MDKLPKGWKIVEWNEVLTIKNGKNQKNVIDDNGLYPIYGSGGIMGYANDFICNEQTTIIGRKGSINNPIYVTTKFWNVDTAFGICAGKYLDNKFLHYFCVRYDFTKHNKSTTLPSLTKTDLLKIQIPLPPLSEQIRIVTKLNTLFGRIDKSIDLLEENIKHTKGLMLSVLEEVFRDAENKWKFKRLKLATSKIGSGSTPRGGNDSYKASGISLIRSMNVHDGEFRHAGLAFIDDVQAEKLANVAIKKDDVLLNITGASVARCSIVDDSILPARVNQHVSIIRPTSELNPHFLQAYLISPTTKSKLLFNSGGGATREAITKSMIENLEVPIPEVKIQQRIINHIQKIKEVNSKIIIEYQSKLTYLKALKSSLLDRAFKGDL